MRLLLIRHGQTDLNVQKRLQGSSDIPLNDNGRNQAKETNSLLKSKGLCPTHVISSPLERAIETGHIVSEIPESEIEIEPDLIEMAFGIYEQRNMTEENPEFLKSCFDQPATYVAPEGGESYEQVLSRVSKVIEGLRKRIYDNSFKRDDIVLLVSHGATSHGIFEYLKKTPRENYWDVDFNNCAIAELFLSEDGKSDDYSFISEGFEKNW